MASCRTFENQVACFSAAGGGQATLYAHVVYEDQGPIAVLYTTADLTIIDPATYLGGGTITPGACPVASPDVEWQKLCDIDANGVLISEFMCRVITRFDASGAALTPSQVDNFELDKVTPYTITGTVSDCGSCDVTPFIGVITDLTALA